MDFRPARSPRPSGRAVVAQSPQRRPAAQVVAASPAQKKLAAPVVTPVQMSSKAQQRQVSPTAQPEPAAQKRPPKPPKSEQVGPARRWPGVVFRVVRGTVITLLVAAGVGWIVWGEIKNSQTAIDSTKYQAVFLLNGQVYFGKLEPFTRSSMKLKDVYYLQQVEAPEADEAGNPQATTSEQSDVELIKLGDEIHGPVDEIVISRDQLLFYENLKSDGEVSQAIKSHKSRSN